MAGAEGEKLSEDCGRGVSRQRFIQMGFRLMA